MVPRNRRTALALILLVLVPTAYLASKRERLAVDAFNLSMKSVGTPEDRILRARVRDFGSDRECLIAYEAREGAPGAVGFGPLLELGGTLLRDPGVLDVEPLLSAGAGFPALVVRLRGGTIDPGRTLDGILAAAEAVRPARARMLATGIPIGEQTIAREVKAENTIIVPAIALSLLLLLLLHYRHAGLVLATMTPAGLTILWLGGVYEISGRLLNPISSLLEPVLLTVGVAGALHLVEGYLGRRGAGATAEEAAARSVGDLWRPSLWAVLTTAVGFLALSVNEIPAVASFGVFAALGVAISFFLTFLVTPCLLILFARSGARVERGRRHDRTARSYAALVASAGRRSLPILCCAAGLAVWGLCGWLRLEVDNDPAKILPADHPFRVTTAAVGARLGGSQPFDVYLPSRDSGDSTGTADEKERDGPTERRKIARLRRAILGVDGVAGPAGPVQRSPRGATLIRALLEPSGSSEREALFATIEAKARALGLPGARCTGTSVRIARDSGRLVRNQLLGMGLAFLLIGVAMARAFGSLRLAILGMLPNLLPCVLLYGTLSWLGHPMTVATAMIGSVMLGLVVDDTIHFLDRYRRGRQGGAGRQHALEHALRHAGRPIIVTSILLALGFATGMLGHLETTWEFAWLSASTILLALVGTLVLLPALILFPARKQIARRPPAPSPRLSAAPPVRARGRSRSPC